MTIRGGGESCIPNFSIIIIETEMKNDKSAIIFKCPMDMVSYAGDIKGNAMITYK